jgi:hypothetical protein
MDNRETPALSGEEAKGFLYALLALVALGGSCGSYHAGHAAGQRDELLRQEAREDKRQERIAERLLRHLPN